MAETLERTAMPTLPVGGGAHAAVPAPPLDEVLLAMDAVDAIRHERNSVAKDLSEDEARAELVRRVRSQYEAQGIQVSDALIEEAIRAQDEKRFVFVPPADSLQVRLGRLYATRRLWARKAALLSAAALGIGLAPVAVLHLADQSRRSAESVAVDERQHVIPDRIAAMLATVDREAREQEPKIKAAAFAQAARNALSANDPTRARAELAAADRMVEEMRLAYEVRIVTGPHKASGFWRVPRDNPGARNYYLVVEAAGPNGPLPRRILNEETNKVDTVTKWGVRVPDEVFEAVRRDKADDGIISNKLVGVKEAGRLSIDWRMAVRDGAVTKWEPAPGSRNR
ncbi:DUF6384 family protein [Methylobacterium brachiatum]